MAKKFRKATANTSSGAGKVGEFADKIGAIASSLSEQPTAIPTEYRRRYSTRG